MDGGTDVTVVPDPDSVPPEVVFRIPAHGEDQVSVRTPIRAVFSEAVKLGANPVTLLADGVAIATTSALSDDAKVLTVSPKSEIAVPAKMSLSFEDVTDLRGNSLVRAPWSWTDPLWLRVGDTLEQEGTISFPRIAAGTGERVNVALALPQTTESGMPLTVQAIDTPKSTWALRGARVGMTLDRPNLLTESDGTLVVAYKDPLNGSVRVQRLEDGVWRQIGGPFPSVQGNGAVALAADAHGMLFLAYDESTEAGTTNVVVKTLPRGFDSWSPLAETVNDPSAETATDLQSLTLDKNGIPYVAYRTATSDAYVRFWSVTKWSSVGTSVNGPQQAVKSMTIGLDDTSHLLAVLSWHDRYLTTRHAQLTRFDGVNWVDGGDVANDALIDAAFLGATRDGHMFAYLGTDEQFFLLDVTTKGWVAMPPPAVRPPKGFASAAVDPTGVPIFGWTDGAAMNVVRLNR